MPQDTALLRLRIAKLRAAILTVQLAKGDGHVPPEGVRSAARRGLEARKKWGRGGLSNTEASDQGIGSGVQRAANLANGDAVSTETVRRMHAFFSRHAKNYRPDAKEPDGGPTAGTIAWWLWGGNAGKAWAASIVADEERKDVRKRVEELVEKISRWPAGSPGAKGGQFAPAKGGAGGGFKAPQLGLSGPLSGSSGAGGQGSFWSAPAAAKAPPPGAKAHPAGTDDKGKPVTINYPTKPSAPETWNDPDKVATFVPGGETPPALNGVAFRPWKPPAEDAGWATVAGQNAKIEEDPFEAAPGKGIGTGVVIVEPDGRVWLTKPTNEFGGYEHTFPKGGMEPGLPMQANAIKEAYEETGLKVEITGVLGDFERTTSKARYYVARRVSGTPSAMGWETQAMRLAPVARMKSLLNMGVDKSITDAIQAEIEVGGSLAKARGLLARARVLLAKAKAPGGGNSGAWAKQPRWPSGTPVGGQFKAYDSDGIPTPPPKIGSAGNMGPQKAAQALYALAKSGDLAGLKDYAAKNAGKLAAWNQGSGKGLNTQAKWAAMNAYYAGALADTLQAAPKAEAAAAKIRGPEKLSSMTKIGAKPGGSNPGGIYQDGKGDAWLVKGNAKVVQGAVTEAQSNDRAKNEILASKLMAAVGAGTVEMKLVDLEDAWGLGGGLGVAGKMLDGFQALNTKNAAHLAATQADFAVHAWLGNYDVLGMGADNTVIKDGKAINIDPGGAILFRAQGLPKDKFGDKADEWDSMRTTTAEQKAVYGKMTASQLTESAKKLQQIDGDTIKKLVDAHGPGDAAAKAQLAQTLIARRDDILTRAGLKGAAIPPATAASAAPPVAAPAPTAGPASAPKIVMGEKLTFKDGNSDKFWQVAVVGTTVVTQWGKTGAEKPAQNVKEMGSVSAAVKEATKIAASKKAKGYQDAGDVQMEVKPSQAPAASAQAAPAPDAPAAPRTTASVASAPAVIPTSVWANKPTFNTGLKSDAYYTDLTNSAEAAYLSGDLAALKALKNDKAKATWAGNTANSKKLVGFHAALVADLEAKAAAEAAKPPQTLQQGNPTPAVQTAAAMGAATTVPFALPAKPTNIATPANPNKAIIAGVDQIDSIAQSFLAGQLSQDAALGQIAKVKFSGNSQGAKGAKYQSAMISAIQSATASAMPAPAAQTAAPAAPAVKPAGKAPKAKPTFKPDKLSTAPDFLNWGGSGKAGPSGVAWVNQANADATAAILAAAKTGSVQAINQLQLPVVDKATGQVVSQSAPQNHPSQLVKGFAEQMTNEINAQLSPPRRFRFEGGHPLKALDASYPIHKGSLTGPKVKKLGYYVVLGEPGSVNEASLGLPPKATYKNKKLTLTTYSKPAQEAWAKMPKQQRDAIQSYTGSGYSAINGSLWQGNPSGAAKAAAEAFKTLAHDIQPGTILSRKISLYGQDLAGMQASVGKILQEPAVSSTTIDPDIWSGNIQLKMTVGPGVKGLFVGVGSKPGGDAISFNANEKEVLLPPNTRMLVQKVAKSPDKDVDGFGNGSMTVIEVIILPTEF